MKKTFNIETETIKKAWWYKTSAFMMKQPVWLLFVLTTIFSIVDGYVSTQSSIIMKSFVNGETEFTELFTKYVTITLVSITMTVVIQFLMKAYTLKSINDIFVREYARVFDSKTSDISSVGPAKIESAVKSIACLKSERGRIIIRLISNAMPFLFTIWNVGKQNLYATVAMIVIMATALTCSVKGDDWLHFNTIKSSFKGDMRSISINNFLVVRMLKYMNARTYSIHRLDDAQNNASPVMHNTLARLYNAGLLNVLYNTPTLIALFIAIKSQDVGLVVFVIMNEWAIMNMIDNAAMMAENISETKGEMHVIETLKGDDTPIDEKPAMPESMTLRDVEFYYPSDKEHRNAFCIPEFHIEKGKRYRFASPSGGGKSTMFRYFAGEMEANKPFDVRTFYIHQRTELVTGTVRENITLGNPWVPDAVIEELIRDVRLEQWYNSLPDGLDTKLGDAGLEPSGGEASRISLLRLFIHIRGYNKDGACRNTNDIIILDEVTSALDKRDIFVGKDELSTEEAVIKVIDRECAGCTMFVISHEDANSRAFGFKDIVDEQLQVVTSSRNGKFYHTLKSDVDEYVCVHHKIAI